MELVEHIGELGLKLHTGRSRNEQIATDLRLYVREQARPRTAVAARMGDGACGAGRRARARR